MRLNGAELELGANDELPQFKPEATAEGTISLAPATHHVARDSERRQRSVSIAADGCYSAAHRPRASCGMSRRSLAMPERPWSCSAGHVFHPVHWALPSSFS